MRIDPGPVALLGGQFGGEAPIAHTPVVNAAILTIGNEVVSGDTLNSNAAWLGKRLETLGVKVVISASVPDEIERIADFLNRERQRVDIVIVTGGLGGTPDDLTREALAATFEVEQVEQPELAADLRARFPDRGDYVARWAALPAGSRPLVNPRGGAPGFKIENVWVLPGLPSEMKAMFDACADEFGGGAAILAWRRVYRLRESEIADLLVEVMTRWPTVSVGSYPHFDVEGPEVEVVLKESDETILEAAAAFLEPRLQRILQ